MHFINGRKWIREQDLGTISWALCVYGSFSVEGGVIRRLFGYSSRNDRVTDKQAFQTNLKHHWSEDPHRCERNCLYFILPSNVWNPCLLPVNDWSHQIQCYEVPSPTPAVWTRQALDSGGILTINSQASYWWIAVNINKPSNQEEEEGEEGRGGEGEATMGYISRGNIIRTWQGWQLVRQNRTFLIYNYHLVFKGL